MADRPLWGVDWRDKVTQDEQQALFDRRVAELATRENISVREAGIKLGVREELRIGFNRAMLLYWDTWFDWEADKGENKPAKGFVIEVPSDRLKYTFKTLEAAEVDVGNADAQIRCRAGGGGV